MSRSEKKYPLIQISNKIDKDRAHKALRKKVKQELLKEEPDLSIIEGDTRANGDEEFGTAFDFILDDEEIQKKVKRK